MQWMQPFDLVCVHAQADVRVGGRFRVIMRSPDGTDHDVSGEYREVIPGEKLVFTWAWRREPERESLVTVMLRADAGGTDLLLKHERLFDEAVRDAHRDGWSSSLDRLVALFRRP